VKRETLGRRFLLTLHTRDVAGKSSRDELAHLRRSWLIESCPSARARWVRLSGSAGRRGACRHSGDPSARSRRAERRPGGHNGRTAHSQPGDSDASRRSRCRKRPRPSRHRSLEANAIRGGHVGAARRAWTGTGTCAISLAPVSVGHGRQRNGERPMPGGWCTHPTCGRSAARSAGRTATGGGSAACWQLCGLVRRMAMNCLAIFAPHGSPSGVMPASVTTAKVASGTCRAVRPPPSIGCSCRDRRTGRARGHRGSAGPTGTIRRSGRQANRGTSALPRSRTGTSQDDRPNVLGMAHDVDWGEQRAFALPDRPTPDELGRRAEPWRPFRRAIRSRPPLGARPEPGTRSNDESNRSRNAKGRQREPPRVPGSPVSRCMPSPPRGG
jgi:hypothetical protein